MTTLPGYALAVTAVTERADLFVECTESLFNNIDLLPDVVLVHEDWRPGTPEGLRGRISSFLRDYEHEVRLSEPNVGMGRGMLWAFERAAALGYEFVLYTQEDWRVVRPLPVARCLSLMAEHGLHHVRFNKRKTMRAKHEDTPNPWKKIEVQFGEPPVTLCVSDHWYTQTSIWRISEALPGLRFAAEQDGANRQERFVGRFNDFMNQHRHGLTPASWNDQALRHERLRTYIWGAVGEPRFIEHAGSHRGTGTIKDHIGET